jgi:putative CocE/NonD family hydrolase
MNRKQIAFLIIAACTVLTISLAQAANRFDITIERGVSVKMRDGVVLLADIYRPKQDGWFPVLLQRTPYNKDNNWGTIPFAYKAVAAGYVVIVQDVRGRYTSKGEWYPFEHESNDGYDTIEWAAALPYSNGKVGMFGGSYVGATQMLAAIAHPPHLAGINPTVTASNYHDGWTYQSGAFEQWFNESWTSGLAQDTLNRTVEKNTNAMIGASTLPLANYSLFNSLQVASGPELTAPLAPYFLDWLAHPTYDDYWKRWSIEDHFADITVPVFTFAAWYDIFQGGSLRNYMGLKLHGGSEAARHGQRLLMEIGGHAGSGRKIGDVDFGPTAEIEDSDITLAWYDYLFKGVQNDFAKAKPVKIFVMGANEWREEDDWPVPQARATKYFLHSDGSANSNKGNGSLSPTAPSSESPDHYVYDPANPVQTIGGPLCCDEDHLQPGPRDQRTVESRNDVLIYSTPLLTQDMEVTGPVSLELYAKSSGVDTDFTAKLVDVAPDGFAQNMTEGIVRARYRNSQEKADLLKPDEVYKFNIDLWSTSNVFRKGHILRLEISSSNFPRFDRNLNTEENPESGKKYVSATNTIYHDAQHPSVLLLQIVPTQ